MTSQSVGVRRRRGEGLRGQAVSRPGLSPLFLPCVINLQNGQGGAGAGPRAVPGAQVQR